mmetsp:Transcript_27231/g.63451  ORF Transcript_27231/g.63451 Transcript_27231/m.63451 type:complete len:205 (-) Transcript_27231:159-773(-)
MAEKLDVSLTQVIQRLEFGFIDYLVVPGACLFGWAGIGPVVTAVALYAGVQGFYLTMLALAVGQVANRFFKVLLQRARPVKPQGVKRLIPIHVPGPDDPDGASFPSGDTMAAAVVGASLALSGCGSVWWLLGVYSGFARVYFWCHYVADVTAGYFNGCISALIVASLSDGGKTLHWKHVVAAMVPFMAVMKLLKKLQLKKAGLA